ncbi:MAG: GntR family transcriptional regulator [Treponema sp.]|nr:GntR family transcriptional regulator [Treponema sp.]
MSLDFSVYIPRYIQIKDYLLSRIKTSAPDSLIPGETTLADQFKVSRGTVKQAIMDLVYEGLLYRVQGKGTFVAPVKIPRSFDRLPTFTDDIRKMGYQSHSKVLRFGMVEPTEKMRDIFGLVLHTPLVRFRRLVELDGQPIVVVSSYLSPLVFPCLELSDIHESLYGALQKKYGKVPTKARDTYSIVEAFPEIAGLLQIPDRSGIFYSERISFLEDMTPAEYVESYIRGDRFKLDICIGAMDETNKVSGAGNESSYGEGNYGATHYGIGFRNIITQNTADK